LLSIFFNLLILRFGISEGSSIIKEKQQPNNKKTRENKKEESLTGSRGKIKLL